MLTLNYFLTPLYKWVQFNLHISDLWGLPYLTYGTCFTVYVCYYVCSNGKVVHMLNEVSITPR
jgi:hypothetical protein